MLVYAQLIDAKYSSGSRTTQIHRTREQTSRDLVRPIGVMDGNSREGSKVDYMNTQTV